MLQCMIKTRQEFNYEDQLIKEIYDVFIEIIDSVEDITVKTNSELAVVSLSAKNFKLFQSILDCLYYGYYESGMILLRSAYENLVLMLYLAKNENDAEGWLRNKKAFRQSELRQKVGFDNELYKMLSNFFTHPNKIESLQTMYYGKGSDHYFKIYPRFEKEGFQESFNYLVSVYWLTVLQLQFIFKEKLWSRNDFKKRIDDMTKTVMKYIDDNMINVKVS